MMKPTLLILAAMIVLPLPARSDVGKSKPVKVFLLAGQSNMEGQAVVELDGSDYNDGKGTLVKLMADPAKAAIYGVTDITSTSRKTLPKWAAIADAFATLANYSTQTLSNGDYAFSAADFGPSTTYVISGPGGATCSIGRYIGHNDYLGDRTNALTGVTYQQGVDFELDQYNGRYCVTPDFTNGTYAYFVANDASRNPVFPYKLAKQYYGAQSGTAQGVAAFTV